MSAPRIRRLAASAATIFLLVLFSACSSKDTSSPQNQLGPMFNFTFPATGVSVTRVFTEAGSWDYRCTSHAGMVGTVNVDGSSMVDSALVQVGAGGNVFSPTSVTIRTNGKVRWVNVSGTLNHTVTR